jgi:hypothetical protein
MPDFELKVDVIPFFYIIEIIWKKNNKNTYINWKN